MQDDLHTIGGGGRVFSDHRRLSHRHNHHHHHHKAALKCPRCDSINTKFCYYNNYNLSQPRHFCKNCRRYWTNGGVLRNVPVGGGCRRKPKRTSTSATYAAVTATDRRDPNPNGISEPPLMESNQVAANEEIWGFNHLGFHSGIDDDGTATTTTASFSQWEIPKMDGGSHEDETMQRLVGGILDPTVGIDDLLPNGRGLFDLPPYWTQTTTYHPHWADHSANNDHPLFFP